VWTTAVKQSNDFKGTGNDFVLVGTDPAISTTGCQVADHVSFGLACGDQSSLSLDGAERKSNGRLRCSRLLSI